MDVSADLPSGSYNTDKTVQLSASDSQDPTPQIYYTLDGSDPTTGSNVYNGPINLGTEGLTILKFMSASDNNIIKEAVDLKLAQNLNSTFTNSSSSAGGLSPVGKVYKDPTTGRYIMKVPEGSGFNKNLQDAIEIENILTVAMLVTESALLRRESRGAHYREDYPETNDKWARSIVLNKNTDFRYIKRGLSTCKFNH